MSPAEQKLHEGTLIVNGQCDNGECWCYEKPEVRPSNQYLSDNVLRLSNFYDAVKDRLSMGEQNELWSIVGNLSKLSVQPVETECSQCAAGMNLFTDPITGQKMHARNGVVVRCSSQTEMPRCHCGLYDWDMRIDHVAATDGSVHYRDEACTSEKTEVPHIMAAIERAEECTCPEHSFYSGCPVHGTWAQP